MVSVVQVPDRISFVESIKSFRVSSDTAISFKLMKGDDVVVNEIYNPDRSGDVTVDIHDVISQFLQVKLPSSDVFAQTDGCASLTALLQDYMLTPSSDFDDSFDESFGSGFSYTYSFKVLAGGVKGLSDTEDFLLHNWLTWQPQTKTVRGGQREQLTYYHTGAGDVKIGYYPVNGGERQTATLHSALEGEYNTYNVSLPYLLSVIGEDAEDVSGVFDLWVEDGTGQRVSWIQRLVFNDDDGTEHYYMAVNSLGGVDTYCFGGALTLTPAITHESALVAGRKISITAGQERVWNQNTGNYPGAHNAWIWDFVASGKHWVLKNGAAEEIVVSASNQQSSDSDSVHVCDFSYSSAEEAKLINLERETGSLPVMPVVPMV